GGSCSFVSSHALPGGTGSDIRAAGGTGAEAPRLRAFWPPEATGAAHARTDQFAGRTTLRSRGEGLLAGLPRRAGPDAGAIRLGALPRRAVLGTEHGRSDVVA